MFDGKLRIFLQELKISAHKSALRKLSLQVPDLCTFQQLFKTLRVLVKVQELRLELVGDVLVQRWQNYRDEYIRELGGNGFLRNVEFLIDGVAMETPQQIQRYCQRNEMVPRRMDGARAHNRDIAIRGGVTGSAPTLSCYPKLFHEATRTCPSTDLTWMLRGLVALGGAVGGCPSSPSSSTKDTASTAAPVGDGSCGGLSVLKTNEKKRKRSVD